MLLSIVIAETIIVQHVLCRGHCGRDHMVVGQTLYKYIMLVTVICEKYRLRGEANIPSGEGHMTVLETGIFRK
jgi:hypothetical protein